MSICRRERAAQWYTMALEESNSNEKPSADRDTICV